MQYRFMISDHSVLGGAEISSKLVRSNSEYVITCVQNEKCSTIAIAYTGSKQPYPCLAYETATSNNNFTNQIMLNQSEFMMYQKIESLGLVCPETFTKVADGCYFVHALITGNWDEARSECAAMAGAGGGDLADLHDVIVSTYT